MSKHKYEIYSFSNIEKVSEAVAKFIEKKSEEAIKKHGVVRVAISGGSLPKTLALKLKESPYKENIKWDKWRLFFADERCVPHDHKDSNYRLVKEELIQHIPIDLKHVYPINQDLINKPLEAAEDYQSILLTKFSCKEEILVPNFDLILLGVGPDGHCCSLFPNHELLNEKILWVAPIEDSPKPPAERITLTLPVINHAYNNIFIVTGDNKKEIIKDIHENKSNRLPARLVTPLKGDCYWFLDDEASRDLQKSTISPFKI